MYKQVGKPKIKIKTKILLSFTFVISLIIGFFIWKFVDVFKKEKIQFVYELNALKLNSSSVVIENEVMKTLNLLRSEIRSTAIADIHPSAINFYNFTVDEANNNKVHFNIEFESEAIAKKEQVAVGIKEHLKSNVAYFNTLKIKDHIYLMIAAAKPVLRPTVPAMVEDPGNSGVVSGQIEVLNPNPSAPKHNYEYQAALIDLNRMVRSLKLSKSGEFFIADTTGNILVSDDNGGDDYAQARIMESPFFKTANKMKGSVNVTRVNGANDEQYLTSITQLRLVPITLVSYGSTKKAFSQLKQLYITSSFIGLIAFAISFALVQLVSNSITLPITRLMEQMLKFSRGESVNLEKIKSFDEVGSMKNAFGQMMVELNKSKDDLMTLNAELEQKVKDRTRELEELTIRDALTGCYNRRFFNQKLDEEITRAKRTKENIGVLYLDIDHFKKYNDQNGHPEGDSLLIGFSKLLRDHIRATDYLCRLGGEEFCIITNGTSVEGMQRFAENVRGLIYTTDFKHGEKQPMGRVSASLGVSIYPLHATNSEDLVKAADEALYHAKEGGRNQWRMAEPLIKLASNG